MSDVPFPPEILVGILSRLPVESLLRFRCVSKSWRALIDSKNFINLHLNHSIETNTNLYFVSFWPVGNERELSYNSLGSPAAMRKKIHHPFGDKLPQVLGSCNGVLCLSTHDFHPEPEYVFLNPLTRRFRRVPMRPLRFASVSIKRLVVDFWYDHVNDDYKLVRFSQCCGSEHPVSVLTDSRIEVYSSKEGLWREVGDLPYYICHKAIQSVYVAGNLHLLVSQSPKPENGALIAAFDLTMEEVHFVPQPELSDGNFKANLTVLGGCLCMVCDYPRRRVDLWVMKSYGVKDSWTKLVSIDDAEIITHMGFLTPLMYSKSGQDVLFHQMDDTRMHHPFYEDGLFDQMDDSQLYDVLYDERQFWYDLEKKTVKHSSIAGKRKLFFKGFFRGSLVQVHGDCAFRNGATKQKMKEEKRVAKKRDDFLSKGFKLVL